MSSVQLQVPPLPFPPHHQHDGYAHNLRLFDRTRLVANFRRLGVVRKNEEYIH